MTALTQNEPGLADTRLSRDQDSLTRPRPRNLEHALKLPELACAPDKHLAPASLHSGSIAQQTPGWKGPHKHPRHRRYAQRGREIRLSARCAPAPWAATIDPI